MLVVMIATISVWFTACSKDDKPDEDYLKSKIIGEKWYDYLGTKDNYILFRENGTYTCIVEAVTLGNEILGESHYDAMNINGMYSIKEIEETTLDGKKETLFKMLASGSNDFDQIWVKLYTVSSSSSNDIVVYFYSGNELVRSRGFWNRI